MSGKVHTVKRLSFELEAEERQRPIELRKNVLELLGSGFKDKLEALLDAYDVDGKVLRIDRLEIDLGKLEFGEIETQLLEKLKFELRERVIKIQSEEAVGEMLSDTNVQTKESADFKSEDFSINQTERQWDVVLFYLKNGTFPWWSTTKEVSFIVDVLKSVNTKKGVAANATFIDKLTERIASKTQVLDRLIYLLDLKTLSVLIPVLVGKNASFIEDVRITMDFLLEKSLKTAKVQKVKIAEKEMLRWMLRTGSEQQAMKSKLLKFSIEAYLSVLIEVYGLVRARKIMKALSILLHKENQLNIRTSLGGKWKDKNGVDLDEINSIVQDDSILKGSVNEVISEADLKYKNMKEVSGELEQMKEMAVVNFSGIVLLWPMLKPLFEVRNIQKDGNFIDDESRLRGLQLLNYMVSGHEALEEHDMTLNKIFCGLSPAFPIIELPTLSEEDKTEVNDLLEHVIKNWSVLKNTSVQALRESFINRQGQLEELDEFWTLKVEQRSIDVLMSSIPWGYSLINLGWMPKLLKVEW